MFKFILTAFILVLLLFFMFLFDDISSRYKVNKTRSAPVLYGMVGLILFMIMIFTIAALNYLKELN